MNTALQSYFNDTHEVGKAMRLLEDNDWIFLNNIIHKIYSTEDLTQMRKNLLELIRLLIPCSVATFYLAENSTSNLLGQPVGIGLSEKDLQDYLDRYEDLDFTRWIFVSAKGMAYRESDLIPDVTREATPLYQQMYLPKNLHHSAQLSIVYRDVFLGIISLYRPKSEEDFSERDIFILDMLKDHLSFRLASDAKTLTEKTNQIPINLSAYAVQFHLTQRETEVFSLLFEELTDEEICSQLFIGYNTLKKHILSIYRKAGINSRLKLFKLVNQKQSD